jgi:tetratricopeptide (TPR) repeat protein
MWKWFKRRSETRDSSSETALRFDSRERIYELVGIGDKMLAAEDFEGATFAYESALRLDGRYASVWRRRGDVFLRRGKVKEALACLVRSMQIDATDAKTWNTLGEAILAFMEKDLEPDFIQDNRSDIEAEARDCFERALKLGGDPSQARRGIDASGAKVGRRVHSHTGSPLFSFQLGGILEEVKLNVVSAYLKPGDYLPKSLPQHQHD